MLAAVQGDENPRMPSTPKMAASPSSMWRILRAASVIHGYRVGPLIAATGNQANATTIALEPELISTVLDLVRA